MILDFPFFLQSLPFYLNNGLSTKSVRCTLTHTLTHHQSICLPSEWKFFEWFGPISVFYKKNIRTHKRKEDRNAKQTGRGISEIKRTGGMEEGMCESGREMERSDTCLGKQFSIV